MCIYKFFIFFIVSRVSQSQNDDSNDSESLSSSSDEKEFADELDRYLSSGHIKGVEDPIMWWHENHGGLYTPPCIPRGVRGLSELSED